jgi:serine/threonine protein kinase
MYPINKSDVDIIATIGIIQLGTGTFSRVALVRLKSGRPTELYALKMINKEILFKLKQVEHAKREKSILRTLNHPFIIKL